MIVYIYIFTGVQFFRRSVGLETERKIPYDWMVNRRGAQRSSSSRLGNNSSSSSADRVAPHRDGQCPVSTNSNSSCSSSTGGSSGAGKPCARRQGISPFRTRLNPDILSDLIPCWPMHWSQSEQGRVRAELDEVVEEEEWYQMVYEINRCHAMRRGDGTLHTLKKGGQRTPTHRSRDYHSLG